MATAATSVKTIAHPVLPPNATLVSLDFTYKMVNVDNAQKESVSVRSVIQTLSVTAVRLVS